MMKRHLLYSIVATAGLALAGCNGDYDDWASPQSYPQDPSNSTYGVTFSAGPDATINMGALASSTVRLVGLNSSSEAVKGYTLKSLTIGGESINGTVDGNNITVEANDLLKMIEKLYGSRASVARPIEVNSEVSINLDNGDAVTGSKGTTTASLTPYSTPGIDPKGYYLLGNFAGNDWSLATPIWMKANGDGTFTASVTTTSEGDNWYKFYMGSYYSDSDWDTVNQGQMGCENNGDNSLTNFLVYTGDPEYTGGVQTPVISGQGSFEITLDMNNLTYTVRRAEAQYYIVGGINNPTWSADACLHTMFYALGGNNYCYTTKWPGAWDLKFWSAKDVGNWDVAWGAGDGDGSYTGKLINTSAGAFQAPSNEYYTLTINMNDETYEWTKLDNQSPTEYTAVSLIGDFNGWGGDIDLAQEANAPHNWYGRATIPSDGGLKFRANHDWATSWGTSADDEGKPVGEVYFLGIGEKNITVPAGTYDFYLNDITGRWSIVAVK